MVTIKPKNTMKLIEDDKKKLILDKQVSEGLVTMSLYHEIKETQAFIEYHGPKIPKDEWAKVIAFFKWTYDTTKSESQVRMYVNLKLGTWRAWAFPQEAKTGMTSRELDNDDSKEQRKQFDEDWTYFSTVHHHCSCTAFQSGTDAANEKDQDGLHITVGKMDEKKHDLHCRFYRKGRCFQPSMAWFWDVSHCTDDIPERVRRFLPENYEDTVAREEMCQPSCVEFPKQWRDNLIEIKPVVVAVPMNSHNDYSFPRGVTYSHPGVPLWQRARDAWEEIIKVCKAMNHDTEDLMEGMEYFLDETAVVYIIDDALRRHKLDINDLYREMHHDIDKMETADVVGLSDQSLTPDNKVDDDVVKVWEDYVGQ